MRARSARPGAPRGARRRRPTSAACSAATSAKGRRSQAASAIHGECSKANPTAATNVPRSAAFNAAMLVIAGPCSIRTLLLRHATLVATFDDAGREIADGAVSPRQRDRAGRPDGGAARHADEVIDARGMVILPGLVNTHHHFYQTLTRNLPRRRTPSCSTGSRALPDLGEAHARGDRVSTAIAIAELMLSGCTTASDHTYIWPNGARLDDQIEAAQEMGFRFHAARGSMSVGESQGGLPPDSVVEDEEAILRDSRGVIESYHDPARYAMTAHRAGALLALLGLARPDARERGAGPRLRRPLCTRTWPRRWTKRRYCLEHVRQDAGGTGRRPGLDRRATSGTRTWSIRRRSEIARLGRTRTGVAHCPTSNMRLASGIAPLRRCATPARASGLGVDGSASNDGSHLLAEARQALLLQRVGGVRRR